LNTTLFSGLRVFERLVPENFRRSEMPEIELCCRCHKEIDREEKYVVVFREQEEEPQGSVALP
jgi:hypothetical protein